MPQTIQVPIEKKNINEFVLSALYVELSDPITSGKGTEYRTLTAIYKVDGRAITGKFALFNKTPLPEGVETGSKILIHGHISLFKGKPSPVVDWMEIKE